MPSSGDTLDFACGTGLIGDAIAEAGCFKGALKGCDISEASLEFIKAKKPGRYFEFVVHIRKAALLLDSVGPLHGGLPAIFRSSYFGSRQESKHEDGIPVPDPANFLDVT